MNQFESPPMSNYRILLLEDDDSLRSVLQDVLDEEGFEVDGCAKSDDAINLARQREYDLMVADIRMEGLDGLAALTHVQSYRPSVHALVISGYADAQQAERTSRLGLGAVLKKPFELDLFLHKVNVLLRERSHKLAVNRAFESLLNTSYWSSLQLARFLDNSGSKRYQFHRLVEVTGVLCSEMNLLGSHLEKVRSATLAAAWRQSHKDCALAPPTDIPDEFEEWFEYLAEHWNGSGPKKCRAREIPLESRIIVTALASCLEGSGEETLEERWPGRFDPFLLAALERHEALPEETSVEVVGKSQSSESLLDLAGTLLRSGDFQHATEALEEVIHRGAESREGVSALLMLARLKQRAGLFEDAKHMAFRTPEMAQAFGPALAAQAYLESGRLLWDLGEATFATTTLQKAYALYHDLGLEAQAAECFLLEKSAAGTLGESPEAHIWIEVLLSPAHRSHAANLAAPLISALLQVAEPSTELQRSLARLMLAHPQAATSALNVANRDQQERAVALIAQFGSQRYGSLCKALLESTHPEVRKSARALAAGDKSASDNLPLNVTTLGGLVVQVGDHRIPDKAWRTSKVRYLFARLVSAHPSPVNEEVLIEEFWPGDVDKGRKSLYTATSSVRGAMRKAGLVSKEYVQKSPTGLVLAPDIVLNYDIAVLRSTLDRAKQAERNGDVQEALVCYRKAALMGENPYLSNCYFDWAIGLRETIQQELLGACVRLTQVNFGNERFNETIEFARRALKIEPANETAIGLLLECLILIGRPAEAMREYQAFTTVLEEELGLSGATSMAEVRRRAVAGVSL